MTHAYKGYEYELPIPDELVSAKTYDRLKQQNVKLLEALKRTEQTLRNLADGMLIGDAHTIVSNEADNIRAAIKKVENVLDNENV